MEFQLSTDLSKELPQSIQFNFEQLKADLTVQLEKYDNLVVTEDAIKDAKDDRAKLNKLKDAINDKKIEVKRTYLEPYDLFERQVKEILGLLDKPILAIDGQIKSFENSAKAKKLTEIELFFNEQVGDLKDIVAFTKIANPKWTNSTYAVKDIQKEIADLLFKVRNDLKVIDAIGGNYVVQMKDKYLVDFNMGSAMQEKVRLEEFEKKAKAQAPAPSPAPVQQAIPTQQVTQSDKQQIDFRVWVDEAEKQLLRQFFIDNNIKYGKCN